MSAHFGIVKTNELCSVARSFESKRDRTLAHAYKQFTHFALLKFDGDGRTHAHTRTCRHTTTKTSALFTPVSGSENVSADHNKHAHTKAM